MRYIYTPYSWIGELQNIPWEPHRWDRGNTQLIFFVNTEGDTVWISWWRKSFGSYDIFSVKRSQRNLYTESVNTWIVSDLITGKNSRYFSTCSVISPKVIMFTVTRSQCYILPCIYLRIPTLIFQNEIFIWICPWFPNETYKYIYCIP